MPITDNMLTALFLFLLIFGTFGVLAKLINTMIIFTTVDYEEQKSISNWTVALCMIDAALWAAFYYSTH